MLDSLLHPKSSSLIWQIAIPRSLTILLIILHFINGASVVAQKPQDVKIPITTPQIIYTPFVCNASIADTDKCSGAWQLSGNNDSISTTGPTPASGNVPPQIFFTSRNTSRLVMTAIPSSNATVNVTISSGGIQIWSLFDSSLGTVTIVNLPSNLVLVAVTYMPSDDPALFGLQSFIVTAPANEPLSSILPSPSLPLPSASALSSSTSSASSSATSGSKSTSKKTKIIEGVVITLVVFIVLATAGFCLFRAGRRRNERLAKARSGWSPDPPVSLRDRLSGGHRERPDAHGISMIPS